MKLSTHLHAGTVFGEGVLSTKLSLWVTEAESCGGNSGKQRKAHSSELIPTKRLGSWRIYILTPKSY